MVSIWWNKWFLHLGGYSRQLSGGRLPLSIESSISSSAWLILEKSVPWSSNTTFSRASVMLAIMIPRSGSSGNWSLRRNLSRFLGQSSNDESCFLTVSGSPPLRMLYRTLLIACCLGGSNRMTTCNQCQRVTPALPSLCSRSTYTG